jgi:CRP-like cAMP-binding protein
MEGTVETSLSGIGLRHKVGEPINVIPLRPSSAASSQMRERTIFDIANEFASDFRFINTGAEAFSEGETTGKLYVVLDGWLILHRILEDGRRQILDFALPGAVLGYGSTPDSQFAFSADALTNVEIATIPLSGLRMMLSGGTDGAAILLNAANEALLGAFDNLTDVGRRTAREAVANFLLRMDRRIRKTGNENKDGSVPFPLTQEHIGDTLGLTAVHVCRTLRVLRGDGLIEVGRGRLTIFDRQALALEAGVFPLGPDLPKLPAELNQLNRNKGKAIGLRPMSIPL